MQKRKSVDWFEFRFESELRGLPLSLIQTDRYINCAMHDFYQAGRYEIMRNKRTGSWFVQWTGKDCAVFDPVEEIWKFAEFTAVGLVDIFIKRIDIAFDLACPMPRIDRGDCQTRAKVYSFTESNGVTHRFGKSPLFLNIYDKRAERLAKRPDLWPYFLEVGGFDDGPITRFEFMCRSESLRKRGVETAADFAVGVRDLESYLVNEWFWIRNSKNRKGRVASKEWREVQSLVQTEFHVSPVEKKGADCRTLKRSGLGSLASAYVGSLSSNQMPTEEGYKEFVERELKSFVPDQGWHMYLGERT